MQQLLTEFSFSSDLFISTNLYFYQFATMETIEKSRGGENLNTPTFTLNPAFLLQDPQDIFTEEDYKRLSFDELVELNLKKDRRIRRYKKKIAQISEKCQIYKTEMERCMSRNHRQKQDNDYQSRTVNLYRRILEMLTEKKDVE